MPLDAGFATQAQAALRAAGRAAALSVEFAGLGADETLARAERHPLVGRLALVSSFGAESVVLLHLVATHAPGVPVLFLETQMHFPETLAYQRDLATALGLDVGILRPDPAERAAQDPGGTLHRSDPDACCALRKVRPLARALAGFDGWITGRKRFQSGRRAALPRVEADGARIKLNPLADWSPRDIAAYIATHDLLRHPLVARGYPSIGCAPCTARPSAGADPRSGRWAGRPKDECGIHFENGRLVRPGAGEARA
jgi:phosphoadenosine phosphosulfate reductase